MLISPARTLSNLPPRSQPSSQKGFTLIELLMVISVIAILAAVTFGVSRGVQNARTKAAAKAEMAVIGQALEQFKTTYGDYPWVDESADAETRGADLLKALTGWSKLERLAGSRTPEMTDSEVQGKSFIEIDRFGVFVDGELVEFNAGETLPEGAYLADPWDNAYAYAYYRDSTTWDNFGYLLFAAGGDGLAADIPADGVLDQSWREESENIDNIYAGE